jgi:hypothetical protein
MLGDHELSPQMLNFIVLRRTFLNTIGGMRAAQ